jgi:hypothetical protein
MVLCDTSEVLVGLRACYVLVENIDADGEAIGLRASTLSNAVELILRRNGLRVVSQEEARKLPGGPYLYVNVQVMKNAYRYDLELKETSQLHRKINFAALGSSTWSWGGMGFHGGDADYIVNSMKTLAEKFANDFLKANPR